MNRTVFAPLLAGVLAVSASGQDKVFNWIPANAESVRLDPGDYHAGHVYRPGRSGGDMHVDIESQKPVTIALVPETQWNAAMQNPESFGGLSFMCMQEHVTKTTYTCHIPPQAMVLVVRDDRNDPDRAVHAGVAAAVRTGDRLIDRAARVGLGTVLTGSGSVTRRFTSPNDLHIQYYSWLCVENCDQPEFRWFLKAKEKYELTPFVKVYGGIFPERDGQQISVKIKSPVPMAVAVLPSLVANQLHQKPEMFEEVLASSSCQQRGVQSLTWQCPLNADDGAVSLVVAPEQSSRVPKKKAEIEVFVTECVQHCTPKPAQEKSVQDKVQPTPDR